MATTDAVASTDADTYGEAHDDVLVMSSSSSKMTALEDNVTTIKAVQEGNNAIPVEQPAATLTTTSTGIQQAIQEDDNEKEGGLFPNMTLPYTPTRVIYSWDRTDRSRETIFYSQRAHALAFSKGWNMAVLAFQNTTTITEKNSLKS